MVGGAGREAFDGGSVLKNEEASAAKMSWTTHVAHCEMCNGWAVALLPDVVEACARGIKGELPKEMETECTEGRSLWRKIREAEAAARPVAVWL